MIRKRLAVGLSSSALALGGLSATPANAEESFTADCPTTLNCVVVPAAHAANSGIDDYGNYDTANRSSDMKINSVVIHDSEGTLQQILDAFKDPSFYSSAQYVVAADGTVYQMVQNKDVTWHAGNWWYNMHSIGIEHVGHAATGGTDYTQAMYESSAKLVKYLADKYDMPLDREHVLGHDNIPAQKTASIAGMHTDPGSFWNWQKYMRLLGNPVSIRDVRVSGNMVTIAPDWSKNKQEVSGCWNNVCVPNGAQSTNFVSLRTEPDPNAPLITDSVLGTGSSSMTNTAARVFYGQTLAQSGKPKFTKTGIWFQVWANGKKGWFFCPFSAPNALPTSAKYVTPKGSAAIPVYGRPSPELSAYPDELLSTSPASFWIPGQAPTAPLSYTIPAGQRYKVISTNVPNDHFYAWSLTRDQDLYPYDGTIFQGQTEFVEIQYGNRVGFVKKTDVTIG